MPVAAMNTEQIAAVHNKFKVLKPIMDERRRRWWAASEAMALGWGGISLVAKATGLSRTTIQTGMAELPPGNPTATSLPSQDRIRRWGGGRHRLIQNDNTLYQDLTELIAANTRGDPQSPLQWTCKSTRRVMAELISHGPPISHPTVAYLLHAWDYSLQAPRKPRDGASPPDRDAQFVHINETVKAFQQRGQPVVSVDAKKKELVGNFTNAGREWHHRGEPEQVNVYAFVDPLQGRAIPYGVNALATNQGWGSVGITDDTAEFAVARLHRWWQQMGSRVDPHAQDWLVTADSGGSNGRRCRRGTGELQKLADATGLRISVCHFPPGTSKGNKMEHRLFCHITDNWRGRPFLSHAIIVNLIGPTTTRTGLQIQAELDRHIYRTGIKVSKGELDAVRLEKDAFHGEWNYTILPHIPQNKIEQLIS